MADSRGQVKLKTGQFPDHVPEPPGGSFEREARAIAAFNHPNICQVHDVGPNYIVMGLIDGIQLSGPLPVEKAVSYAGLILDALDAAHRKGFTHLKPSRASMFDLFAASVLADRSLHRARSSLA